MIKRHQNKGITRPGVDNTTITGEQKDFHETKGIMGKALNERLGIDTPWCQFASHVGERVVELPYLAGAVRTLRGLIGGAVVLSEQSTSTLRVAIRDVQRSR